ncbi:MAG TPA: hypothetical protein VL122_09870 [Nitrospirota bacterium]|nr:hypothetical protein [Nitrospirota bacterium]
MSVEKKNRNEILSQIAADLFIKSRGGEELPSKIHRLRDEINKVIESEDTVFGKFRKLLVSFEEIIPEDKQRYNAAIKALSTTSKLNRQEIIKAVNNQLEELKILEKSLVPAHPGWRDELKVMDAKSREMRDEILKLREKIGRLESEEKGILNDIASREKEMELVEKAVGELFTDIGSGITSIKKRIEEFTSESAVSQPIPARDSIKSNISSEEKAGGEQKSEILESSAPQDTELQKKCPMCGGRMNFYSKEGMWMCYSCAYEELKKDEVQGKNEEKNEYTNAPKPIPAPEPIFDPSPPADVSLAFLSSKENKSKKGSSLSNNQPSSKKKDCPACRKKMSWHPQEKVWRCPFCEYERRI